MIDWNLAIKIFTFGLSAVFGSLAVLIAAIYIFGWLLRTSEQSRTERR